MRSRLVFSSADMICLCFQSCFIQRSIDLPPPLLKISLMLNSILSTSPIIKSYVSHHISTSTTERRFRFLIQIIRDSFQSGWKKKKNFLVIGNNDTSIFIIIIVQLKKLKIFRVKRKILWSNIISFYYSTDYTEF